MRQMNKFIVVPMIMKFIDDNKVPMDKNVIYDKIDEGNEDFLKATCDLFEIEPVFKRYDIAIVAAVAIDRAIGKGSKLLAPFSLDFKRFKSLTKGHSVVMGRKTAESLPKKKPLPGRQNILLTKNLDYTLEGFTIVHSVEQAMGVCEEGKELFCIGGGVVYEIFLEYSNRLYLTEIEKEFPEADVFFPEVDFSNWTIEKFNRHIDKKSANFNFAFVDYLRV